jgi:hypothetical protein
MFPGTDHPNVWYAELEVVVDPVLHAGHGVVGRHDFDAEIRRRSKHFFVGEGSLGEYDVRFFNLPRSKLHAKFRQRPAAMYPGVDQPDGDSRLYIAMPSFSRISLHDLAVDEIAVGVKLVRRYSSTESSVPRLISSMTSLAGPTAFPTSIQTLVPAPNLPLR